MKPNSTKVKNDKGAFARATDPITSYYGAWYIEDHVNRLEQMVVDCLLKRGFYGATQREVSELTGVEQQTIGPRFAPLRRKGLIFDSGEKRRFRTAVLTIVWVHRSYFIGPKKPLQKGLFDEK